MEEGKKVAEYEGSGYKAFHVSRNAPRLLPTWVNKPLFEVLMKAAGRPESYLESTQGDRFGPVNHPFDMMAACRMSLLNTHHARCIRTKAKATVGLGFVSDEDLKTADPNTPPEPDAARRKRRSLSKVAKALNPLCRVSFQDVHNDIAEDFYNTGNGYIEAVRQESNQKSPIRGIHHASSPEVHVILENDGINYHYEVRTHAGARKFARFGDLDGFMRRQGARLETGEREGAPAGGILQQQGKVAELIHFREASSLAKWYGFPSWLSAVASIELVNAQHKHLHGFFHNRGVPEFFLFVLGKKVPKKDWQKIEAALNAQIGADNSHKSAAINIPDNEVEIQLEKLALEGKGDAREFSMMSETLAMEIVSAHGVPPLLAGIQIPGKLGATNELPNALRAFQALEIGPAQETFATTMGCTLGEPSLNGGLELSEEDFTYRTILDEVDLDTMDVSSQMRQTEPEAAAEGRDLSEGLKKAFGNDDNAGVRFIAAALAAAIENNRAA